MRRVVRKTKLQYGGDRHYLAVFLWPDFKSFDAAVKRFGVDPVKTAGEIEARTLALHHPAPYRQVLRGKRWRKVPARKLGEVHFVRGNWNLEIVVHELTHAAFHRFRACVALGRRSGASMEDEESVCYPVGVWAGQVYRWLWKTDPPNLRKAIP